MENKNADKNKKDLSANDQPAANTEDKAPVTDTLKEEAITKPAVSKGSSPATERKETMRQVEVKRGHVVIAMADNLDNEFSVSEQNWISQYQSAKKKDGTPKYKLISEKKT